jgi:hypothetical protein
MQLKKTLNREHELLSVSCSLSFLSLLLSVPLPVGLWLLARSWFCWESGCERREGRMPVSQPVSVRRSRMGAKLL